LEAIYAQANQVGKISGWRSLLNDEEVWEVLILDHLKKKRIIIIKASNQ
jgi:hypothetical protein